MKCLELSVLFLQSLESALFYLLFSPAGETMMNLAALIGSSPLSLFIFTIICFIGLIVGISWPYIRSALSCTIKNLEQYGIHVYDNYCDTITEGYFLAKKIK